MTPRRRDLALTALVAVLLGYSWMFGEITVPNERSRVYLSVAIVDYDTIAIDAAVRRFGSVADVAQFRGHLYTDKAPGASFLGAIVYRVARLFVDRDELTIEALVNLMRTWLMWPTGVLGFVLLRSLLRRVRTSEAAVDVTSLAFALGTAYFHYAAAFLGHALVTVLFLAALWLLPADGVVAWKRRARLALAGAAAGLAGLTEYQAIVPAAMLFAYVAWRERRQPSGALAFAVAAAPFAVALLAYQDAAFGGPFELSYEHLANASVQARHARGIAGVGAPTKLAVLGTLLSPHRGLIATSPIVLLVPFGLWALHRAGETALAVLLLAQSAYFLAFVFGADMWYAGWGFGPRLLVPAMGGFFLAVGPALDRAFAWTLPSGIARGLAAWGIAYCGLVTEVFPELPEEFLSPGADAVLPALARGLHSPNLVTRFGADFGLATLAPAWALTAVALAVVLGAGLARLAGPARRALAVGIALAIPLALAAVIVRVGPTVGARAQARFVDWVAAMVHREENPLPRGVAGPRRSR